ncbi:hypothetical protein [Rhizobium leguminosarum]|uniref:TnsA endonuclease N-terminal domain-containing protein n=1 Tax=Rhizobium leguminosarum TaxID=384 RepID=A0A1B1C8I3_RHILE|nr:hypothetical protein [Rhizobium leguminosarum]ANP86057.1 hypothetical protein BA011_10165 [Rhizobium leguminosarum]
MDVDIENVSTTVEERSAGTIARILWASDGGPVRRIINGRQTKPTGTFPSIKAGMTMPWESRLERIAFQMADASSRIDMWLAQPHRLEMMVRGRGAPLLYFPDMMLKARTSLGIDLQRGMSFSEAAAKPVGRGAKEHLQTIILEIKEDVDPRDGDEAYQQKLVLAKEVYRRRGFKFFELRRKKHFTYEVIETVRRLNFDKWVAIDAYDEHLCQNEFKSDGPKQYWRLAKALGDGPFGRAKLHALHSRGFVSIDLNTGLKGNTNVWLLEREAGR